MLPINRPDFDVEELFMACVSTVNDVTLKADLEDCIDVLKKAETDFNSKFLTSEIHQIPQNDIIKGVIGKKEMKIVYDYRMVNQKMPGRPYYDRIIRSAPNGKCPLCSVRIADTVDHYLPKMKYPIYALTPITLVPACTICNEDKHIAFPTTSEEQTLHPYYDNIDGSPWLRATVVQTSPVIINYFVAPGNHWTQLLTDRTRFHFSAYKLNELFSTHANDELRGAKRQLINLFNEDPELMIHHLREAYESRLELGQNSWQAVLYRTLLDDQWFCGGGVLI
jgi:hypothetical protein